VNPQNSSSVILGINGVLTESVTSKISTSGGHHTHKLLKSSPANWHQIVGLLDRDDLAGVMVKIHGGDYFRVVVTRPGKRLPTSAAVPVDCGSCRRREA
jgi:hypothetical protein